MPESAIDPNAPICRAIRRLREHSRTCGCVEARRALIGTERWMIWMLRREEGEGGAGAHPPSSSPWPE